ncbi:MAG TPA: hypothetical protein VM282_26975 [Acidimicrobiales bacterium]|nr:hypothetical protein [Acidimicrobiales bacterium]
MSLDGPFQDGNEGGGVVREPHAITDLHAETVVVLLLDRDRAQARTQDSAQPFAPPEVDAGRKASVFDVDLYLSLRDEI